MPCSSQPSTLPRRCSWNSFTGRSPGPQAIEANHLSALLLPCLPFARVQGPEPERHPQSWAVGHRDRCFSLRRPAGSQAALFMFRNHPLLLQPLPPPLPEAARQASSKAGMIEQGTQPPPWPVAAAAAPAASRSRLNSSARSPVLSHWRRSSPFPQRR